MALLILLQAVFLSFFLPDDLDADDLQLDLEESKLHPTIQCTPSPGEQPGKPFSLNTAGLLQTALNPQSPTTLPEVFHSHEDHSLKCWALASLGTREEDNFLLPPGCNCPPTRRKQGHCIPDQGGYCFMLLSSLWHSLGIGLVGPGKGWDLATALSSTARAAWQLLGLTLGFVFFQVPSSLVITSSRVGSSAWESGSLFWSQCCVTGWSSWLSLPLPATSLQLSSSSAP